MKLNKLLLAFVAPIIFGAGEVQATPVAQSKTCFYSYNQGKVETSPCTIEVKPMSLDNGTQGAFMIVEYESGRTDFYGVWETMDAQHTPHGTKEVINGEIEQSSDGDLILLFDDHAFSWLPQN